MQLVMFDVDGTLVNSNDFDGPLFAEAIRDVLGLQVDTTWKSYRNVTDSGILEELLSEDTFHWEREVLYEQIKNQFVGLTQDYMSRHPDAVTEIPGARALMTRLRELPEIQIAIATGGWRETAELKLDAVGIEFRDLPLATSSDAISRTEIMRLAEEQSARHGPLTRKWYFGDADWDKRASEELGYEFVAVGPRVKHRIAFPDLSDLPGILTLLGLSQGT
jgi:phosphoglycolate phosphatase-like HAD superfamily hydrolase